MTTAPWAASALVGGYLLGSIPFGLVLTRLAGYGDIRAIGSGNIGATNVLRTGNKGLAAAVLLLDALKGAAAVLIAGAFHPMAAAWAALGAFLGHLFPVWLRFKGGKGVATALGILLALAWPVGLIALGVWIAVAAGLRYSSAAALAAATAAALAGPFLLDRHRAALIGVLAAFVWVKHTANIVRLRNGTEPRIGRKAPA